MSYREIEIQKGENWETIEFDQLQVGDIVRYKDDITNKFKVTTKPAPCPDMDGRFRGNYQVVVDKL